MLPIIDFAQLTLPQSSTSFSPFEVIYGSSPRLSFDWDTLEPINNNDKLSKEKVVLLVRRIDEAISIARKSIIAMQERMRKATDRYYREVNWKVGDDV